MRTMLRGGLPRFLNGIRGEGLRGQLLRGGIGSIVVKTVAMSLSLAMTLALARLLGPEGFGIYSYVFALITMLAIPVQKGLPQLVVRETAQAHAEGEWSTLKGNWRWATVVAVVYSLVLAVLGGLMAFLLVDRFTEAQITTFTWGLVLVPVMVLAALRGAALQGLRHVVTGQLPDKVLRQGLLLVLVWGYLFLGNVLTPERTMAIHAVAAGLAFVGSAIILHKVVPGQISLCRANYQHRAWATAAVPLGLMASMMIINRQADILLLGLFVEEEQVGIYRVAAQGSMLVSFGLQAVNMVVAPQFARMYKKGNQERLQKLATMSSRAALASALPIALFYIFFGRWLLGSLVGEEYVSGTLPLVILTLGHVVNAGMGPVGYLLNMTGQEAVVTRNVGIAVMLNIIGNILLIPLLGMNGAATATAITFLIWNGLLAIALWKRLGINSTVFGRGGASR